MNDVLNSALLAWKSELQEMPIVECLRVQKESNNRIATCPGNENTCFWLARLCQHEVGMTLG
jgi:hypothetical protein